MNIIKTRINPHNGQTLSILGFGCMRFPTQGGAIDEPAAEKLLLRAIDGGVNYFDTAYIYHSGKSESFLGKFLAEHNLRDKVYIATKLPTFLVHAASDLDKIFNKQKSRLQTNRIDYYLIHMLADLGTWQRLCTYGIEAWIDAKKASGEIGEIGFSFHGGREQFKEVLAAYPWEFTQIQYNYLDENNQAGKSGLIAASALGIPVISMEPLRGGKLVNCLPKEMETLWGENGGTPVSHALNWVWNHKEITLLLSGMGAMEQVEENLALANVAEAGMLSEDDLKLYAKAREILNKNTRVPCTGCGYCMPCPHGVDIPTCFSCYNEVVSLGTKKFSYLQATGAMFGQPAYASKCVKCGKCEPHCPQGIKIRDRLSDVARDMEKFPFKLIAGVAKRFM